MKVRIKTTIEYDIDVESMEEVAEILHEPLLYWEDAIGLSIIDSEAEIKN